ncbi:hypothetical protein PXK00_10685 [Phaeobacter sp. QD34_3]|uniref:hypothetical protein n=1 Tax=unclassified Phaeobacter TaxID=2621772 RepID=UPI00237EF7DB|nr:MULTISPECIES: hypothetical protein [unclassified Phaeobacter]MDE4133582.1 hypothetical protein [Phaeobacter sp. QD34_3]MDE4137218.1 hypothetical protein [Phaeobacter sp. QD34_24]
MDRRRDKTEITPLIEDAGLFKRELRDVPVELIPTLQRNGRGDLLIKGVVQPDAEIEVLFAGRRLQDVGGLLERIKALRTEGLRTAMNGHDAMLRIRRLRLPIRVLGNWRMRFETDESGWDLKSYQLIAAQWIFTDLKGFTVRCGALPEVSEDRLQDRARAARAQLAASRARVAERARPTP